MAVHVRVRQITNDGGNRLLRTVRRDSGSVVKLADYFVRGRWLKTSLTRGCGRCSVTRGSRFQAVKAWKSSTDPHYEAKKNRRSGCTPASSPASDLPPAPRSQALDGYDLSTDSSSTVMSSRLPVITLTLMNAVSTPPCFPL